MAKIFIEGRRDGYTPEQCGRTMTVGELIAYLENFDEDAKIYLENDGGYTYGYITKGKEGKTELKETSVPALGHDKKQHAAKIATCTAVGWDDYATCSRCDYTTYQEIAALGHSMTEHQAVEVTCTTAGNVHHYSCSRCDKNYADKDGKTELTETTIAPLGHDKQSHEAQPATCTAVGWDAYETCSRCDYTTYQEIAALGHTMTEHKAVEATCTTAGNVEYWSCSVCNKNYADIEGKTELTDTLIPAAHKWNDNVCTVCELDAGGSKGLSWQLSWDEKSYEVIGIGTCTDTELVIPELYNGEPVTNINANAFRVCRSLASIVIPDSVTSIGARAFMDCSSLTNITIPDGVTSIGESAFEGCSSLTSIAIPDSVSGIGGGVFYGCKNLKSVNLSKNMTSMRAAYVFSGLGLSSHGFFECCSNLTNVIIPDSVTSIGENAFWGCKSLMSIVIPDGVTSIGWHAFYNCSSLETVNWNAKDYTSAGNGSYPIFDDCRNLTTVNIGSNVKTIPTYAFQACRSLTSVVIPDSVTSIGERAFEYCSSLTSVTIGNGVTSIGDYAFQGCYKLVEVYNLSALEIEKGSSENGDVGYYAKDVYTTLDAQSKLTQTDDGYIFYHNEDKIYLMGYTGTETEITLPESYNGKTYEIYEYAFYKSSLLMSITIPDSVTSIGNGAFEGCSKLENVYYKATAEEWEKIQINSYGNKYLTNATRYYYSETEQTEEGNYWHYAADGVTVVEW